MPGLLWMTTSNPWDLLNSTVSSVEFPSATRTWSNHSRFKRGTTARSPEASFRVGMKRVTVCFSFGATGVAISAAEGVAQDRAERGPMPRKRRPCRRGPCWGRRREVTASRLANLAKLFESSRNVPNCSCVVCAASGGPAGPPAQSGGEAPVNVGPVLHVEHAEVLPGWLRSRACCRKGGAVRVAVSAVGPPGPKSGRAIKETWPAPGDVNDLVRVVVVPEQRRKLNRVGVSDDLARLQLLALETQLLRDGRARRDADRLRDRYGRRHLAFRVRNCR